MHVMSRVYQGEYTLTSMGKILYNLGILLPNKKEKTMEVIKVTRTIRIYPPDDVPAITGQLLEDGVDFQITHLREGLEDFSVNGISVELTRVPPLPPFFDKSKKGKVANSRDSYDLAFTRAESATIPEDSGRQEERDAHEKHAGDR